MFRSRIRSIRCAAAGIAVLVRSQHNARIHALATLAAVALGLACRLSPPEWCWITLAAAAVWTAEALNTALEFLCDVACPTRHEGIRHAKDVAAGAVLLAALASLAIAALIFLPRLAPVLP